MILFANATAGGASRDGPVVRAIVEDASIVEWTLLSNAKQVAAAILAEAGVNLKWSRNGPRGNCHERVVAIAFSQLPRNTVLPGSLAYSLPYEDGGLQITIFLDRLQPVLSRAPSSRGAILGHVLAHELVHVVQGFARHSDRGLMKKRWSEDDFQQMGVKPLGFTPEDILLIRKGLVQCSTAP
jgi:hypothetical protein